MIQNQILKEHRRCSIMIDRGGEKETHPRRRRIILSHSFSGGGEVFDVKISEHRRCSIMLEKIHKIYYILVEDELSGSLTNTL